MVKNHSDSERGNPLPPHGQSGKVRSEQAVAAHACHGHRYRPTPAPLSGTGKEKREGRVAGTACTGGYKQADRSRLQPEMLSFGVWNVQWN